MFRLFVISNVGLYVDE